MSVSDHIDTFISITGSNDPQLANSYLDMANQNLENAISLYFEHGANLQTTPNKVDHRLTQEKQHQSYNDEIRSPDKAVHERLVDHDLQNQHSFTNTATFDPFGFFKNQSTNQFGGSDNMFGGGSAGAFSQTNSSEHPLVLDESDDDDEEKENSKDSKDFNYNHNPRHNYINTASNSSTNIINTIDFDTAKAKARKSKKWILINIQDDGAQSKALDREFWSSLTVKGLIRREFILIQYHNDSRSGGLYSQFYQIEGIPHIAIIDPITGEQLKTWTGVPIVKNWYREVENFLQNFSLDKGAINPVTTLQKQQTSGSSSIQNISQKQPTVELSHSGAIDDPIEIDEEEEEEEDDDDDGTKVITAKETKISTEEEQIKAIEPLEIPEPTGDPELITRIQIRTGQGKRVVRKFSTEDQVRVIYQYVKSAFEESNNENTWFILSSQRENLFTKLNKKIGVSGLKNASILLELLQDDEESTNIS